MIPVIRLHERPGTPETIVGMVAEQLAPPLRPFPEVETRRIDNEQSRLALADLNAAVYDTPSDWLRSAIAGETIWQSPMYGYVAYVDGVPASTAFAVPVNGVLYVGFVATAIEYRRRRLAELVIRRSLEDAARATGITRTALHATSDGYPVYLRMGYRPVDAFGLFTPSEAL